MVRTVRSFLAREWPLLAAALALASLAFLPRFIASGGKAEERDREAIRNLGRAVELEPERAEPLLRAFIGERGGSPQGPEARFLLGRAIVLRAQGDSFPGTPALNEAWDALSTARAGGIDRDRCGSLQGQIVDLLDEADQGK